MPKNKGIRAVAMVGGPLALALAPTAAFAGPEIIVTSYEATVSAFGDVAHPDYPTAEFAVDDATTTFGTSISVSGSAANDPDLLPGLTGIVSGSASASSFATAQGFGLSSDVTAYSLGFFDAPGADARAFATSTVLFTLTEPGLLQLIGEAGRDWGYKGDAQAGPWIELWHNGALLFEYNSDLAFTDQIEYIDAAAAAGEYELLISCRAYSKDSGHGGMFGGTFQGGVDLTVSTVPAPAASLLLPAVALWGRRRR